MHHIGTFFKSFGSYATASPTMALEQLRTWSTLLEQGGYVDLTPYAKLLDGVDNVWGFFNLSQAISSAFKALDSNNQRDATFEHLARFVGSGAKATAFIAERYFAAPAAFVKGSAILGHAVMGIGSTSLKSDGCAGAVNKVASVAYSVLSIASYATPYAASLNAAVGVILLSSDLICHFQKEMSREAPKEKLNLAEKKEVQIPKMKGLTIFGGIGHAFDNLAASLGNFMTFSDMALLSRTSTYRNWRQCRKDLGLSRRLIAIPCFVADATGLVSKIEQLIKAYRKWGTMTNTRPPRRIGFPYKRVMIVSQVSLAIINRGIALGLSFGSYLNIHLLEYASFEVLSVAQNVASVGADTVAIALSVNKVVKLKKRVVEVEVVGEGNATVDAFLSKKAEIKIQREYTEITKKVLSIAMAFFNISLLYSSGSLIPIILLRAASSGASFISTVQRGMANQIDQHVKKHEALLT